MKILQRYVTLSLLWISFLVLSVLVALFSFFSLIDQLGDVGRGNYNLPQVLSYVLLTMPRLAYELFPVAAVIGGMAVLGILAKNSELDVIRSSGVSTFQLIKIMAKAGLLLVLLAVLIGEFVAPASEQAAQHLRSVALTEQITLKTKFGFWARDGDSYINIRKILPGNRVEQIYIYEFDQQDRLRNSIYAERATYDAEQWLLEDIRQTVFSAGEISGEERLTTHDYKLASWDSLLNPEIVNLVVVRPRHLSMWGLYHYIGFLRLNAQSTLLYEQALWTKIIRPFSIIAMIVLAVPLVRGNARFTALGQRVFVGAGIGILFHIINQASSHLGVVYRLHPLVSVGAPTLLLIGIIYWLLRED